MKKLGILLASMALLIVAVPVRASIEREAENYDSFDVPADSATMTPVHVQSLPLADDVKYKVVVSGVANAGDSIDFDAECSFRYGSSTEWTDSVSTYESYGEQLLDLYMGSDNDWGACAADHVYSKIVVGDGNPLDFYINDVYPVNNVGVLHVDITREYKNHGQFVSSQENKQEAAQSRIGMPVQSKGHTK